MSGSKPAASAWATCPTAQQQQHSCSGALASSQEPPITAWAASQSTSASLLCSLAKERGLPTACFIATGCSSSLKPRWLPIGQGCVRRNPHSGGRSDSTSHRHGGLYYLPSRRLYGGLLSRELPPQLDALPVIWLDAEQSPRPQCFVRQPCNQQSAPVSSKSGNLRQIVAALCTRAST